MTFTSQSDLRSYSAASQGFFLILWWRPFKIRQKNLPSTQFVITDRMSLLSPLSLNGRSIPLIVSYFKVTATIFHSYWHSGKVTEILRSVSVKVLSYSSIERRLPSETCFYPVPSMEQSRIGHISSSLTGSYVQPYPKKSKNFHGTASLLLGSM